MLLGEHAVLHGHRCLVAAVDRYLRVRLTPRPERVLEVRSALGHSRVALNELRIAPPFQFIWAALAPLAGRLPGGCLLEVEADFDDQAGFGSSSAVTVATLAATHRWLGLDSAPAALFAASLAAIRQVQGSASGADAAAACWGGLLVYRAEPREILPLPHQFPLAVIYSGSKRKTPEVIAEVESRRQSEPELYGDVFALMDRGVAAAMQALACGDLERLGRIVNLQQGLMNAIGVSNSRLEALLERLRNTPGIHGAKISGAGWGDCVYGVGRPRGAALPEDLGVSLSPHGVTVREHGQ